MVKISEPESPKGIYVRDNGYQAICPQCAKRFDVKPGFIGKERSVEIRICHICNRRRAIDEKARAVMKSYKYPQILPSKGVSHGKKSKEKSEKNSEKESQNAEISCSC